MVDYVEFPFDRVEGVHWARAPLPQAVSLGWSIRAAPTPATGSAEVSPLADTGLTISMAVSTTNLPLLSPSTLVINPNTDDFSTFRTEPTGNFPDGTGNLAVHWLLEQQPFVGPGGFAGWTSSNTTEPFGGSNFVSIAMDVLVIAEGAVPVIWTAQAVVGDVFSETVSGTGLSFTVAANMTINPPSVSISSS